MRAIWKGAVSFGLVNVPVRLFAATQEHDIRFHQVHRADGGRIRMRRVCTVCGDEVPYDQLAKGYESPDGRLVVLTDEDFAGLPLVSGREIDVLEFVPSEQVDPILFDRTYYLEPEARATKPYALLREALTATDRMAVVKVALRQRESMAVLRVRDKVIVMQTLLWPDEVRSPDFDVLDTEVELRPQELGMAESLIESLAAEFDPDAFEDQYAKAVSALVEARLEGAPPAPAAEPAQPSGTEVVDLLTALQASVERARATRGAGRDDATAATAPEAPAKAGGAAGGAAARQRRPAKAAAEKATTTAPAPRTRAGRTPAEADHEAGATAGRATKSGGAKSGGAKSGGAKSRATKSAESAPAKSPAKRTTSRRKSA